MVRKPRLEDVYLSELELVGSVNESPPPVASCNPGKIQEGILLILLRGSLYCSKDSVRTFFSSSISNKLGHSQSKKAFSVLSIPPSIFNQKCCVSQMIPVVMESCHDTLTAHPLASQNLPIIGRVPMICIYFWIKD